MLVPEILFGREPDVSRKIKKLLRTVGKRDVADADFGPFIELSEMSAKTHILIDQVARKERGEHLRSYALVNELLGASDSQPLSDWIRWGVESAWRFCCFLGAINRSCLRENAQLRRKYLQAALRYADELDALGPRFVYVAEPALFSSCSTVVLGLLLDEGMKIRLKEPGAVTRGLREYLKEG